MGSAETPQAFQRFQREIEEELRRSFQGYDSPLITMMQYHLGWVDQEGRPQEGTSERLIQSILCLLACEAAGGDYRQALPAAASIELVYNSSLIHDDIQDGNAERHHRPSVWWIWGPAQGINAGDGMMALARLKLFSLTGGEANPQKTLRAVQRLDQACLRLYQGHYMDLSFQEQLKIGVDSYLKMVREKVGALMGCAMELGALMGSNDEALAQSLGEYGTRLGLAFQIREDVLDLWNPEMEASQAGDILNKKKTLPVVYALEKAQGKERRELNALYMKRVLVPEDVSRVREVLDQLEARQFAEEMANQHHLEAVALLDEMPIADGSKRQLREATQYLMAGRS